MASNRLQYSRQQLVDLRNSNSASCDVQLAIPEQLRQLKPVKQLSYSRQQLLAIRDQVGDGATPEQIAAVNCLPDDLRRPSRFRCDSNCSSEQQHETKKVLKYTRNELLRYKQQALQSCAAQTRQLETTAPEIYLRSLGR